MTPDEILFSPIIDWRKLCSEIVDWIENHRTPGRECYPMDRPRPTGALLLYEFLEAYWEYGQRGFFRLEYPKIIPFKWDGIIYPTSSQLPYPSYLEWGNPYYRSVEDTNLVRNTYTCYFIFRTKSDADQGLIFVGNTIVPSIP